LKLPQENIRQTFEDIGVGNTFLNSIPTAQEIRARIDKFDCITLKSFCHTKKHSPESIDNLQNGRKSLPAINWIKDLYLEYIKSCKH
jgi:hypothetical protein